jgi:excisionase family DNA binding protein
MSGFVSLREACELLGDIPASTLFEWVKLRRIAAPRTGYGRVQFYRSSIEAARESLADFLK